LLSVNGVTSHSHRLPGHFEVVSTGTYGRRVRIRFLNTHFKDDNLDLWARYLAGRPDAVTMVYLGPEPIEAVFADVLTDSPFIRIDGSYAGPVFELF